ncbi:fructose-2,6-bisphosphatase [Leptospira hartskeerlii]|uniref:Fructose-2,6-bisphosphatase n=1 Tax=Leptospira hartskeerlii TaxID=2023177 RepID=A0A2M9XFF8_9LEPT|nr:histidine phosphatase family protein [Leptospira hartskeerlii]PJZ26407.1 fructose-2,6-bisphosphatase [Leptospira hartskeerlii]PJZ34492.1 fructose-2,6-bisphosphatase [Leptospira hartskeerlii]
MKKSLCLLRHPSIPPEYAGKYLGRKEVSLSEEGIQEVERIREKIFEKFITGKVYLSPAKQCIETFNELCFHNKLDPEIKEELQELDFGDWEGRSFSELAEINSEGLKKFANFSSSFRFPNGESLHEFQKRAESFKEHILSSSDRYIFVLSHGGILSNLLCSFLGLPHSFYTKFRIFPSTLIYLDIFKNDQAVLTDLIQITSVRRSEWPG